MGKYDKAVAENDINTCLELAGYGKTHEDSEKFIKLMKTRFEGFDATSLSKIRKPDYYGIVLHPDGYEMIRPFIKDDGHKWKCRLSCRLPSDDYRKVLDCFKRDGYSTVQEGLLAILRNYAEIDD